MVVQCAVQLVVQLVVQCAVEPRAVAAAVNSKCTFHLQENGTLAKI